MEKGKFLLCDGSNLLCSGFLLILYFEKLETCHTEVMRKISSDP